MNVSRRYTYADLDELPYDELHQYEIFDGVLHVSRRGFIPHQRALGNILLPLMRWEEEVGTGLAIHSLCTVFSQDNVAIPDVIWIRRERMAGGVNEHGHLVVPPDLVVEVLLPGAENERRDRQTKLALYSREKVEEYWIVDVQGRTVDVYRRDGSALELARIAADDAIIESPLLPGFSLSVSRIWPPRSDTGQTQPLAP